MTRVVIPLYERFTALDVIGAYQPLALAPGIDVVLATERTGPVRDDCGTAALMADSTLAEVEAADVLVVPGGPGTIQALAGPLPRWIGRIHETTRWTTSVCSGSILLAAAGLLTGRRATSHYRAAQELTRFGAHPTDQRVVEEPAARIITAAGVSSGIDMALRLVELLTDATTAQAVQLWMEYDPQPPYDSGHPARVTAEVLARAAAYESAARIAPPGPPGRPAQPR
ncbi:DJ-1/PfpI family protein [Plantactinospora siamensis]|uniref:DJ-1/PfpI family protein n=1 Tax=Plantactinospora siamensis TaxID=555372 RepID=A0ABV6NW38_9ACTN